MPLIVEIGLRDCCDDESRLYSVRSCGDNKLERPSQSSWPLWDFRFILRFPFKYRSNINPLYLQVAQGQILKDQVRQWQKGKCKNGLLPVWGCLSSAALTKFGVNTRRLTSNSSVMNLCFDTSYNASTAATFEESEQYDNPEETPS